MSSNGHQPIVTLGNGAVEVIAWRCESCRRLQPVTIGSAVIHVEDFGSLRLSGAMRGRARYIVKMVVCPPCRRMIANVEADHAD